MTTSREEETSDTRSLLVSFSGDAHHQHNRHHRRLVNKTHTQPATKMKSRTSHLATLYCHMSSDESMTTINREEEDDDLVRRRRHTRCKMSQAHNTTSIAHKLHHHYMLKHQQSTKGEQKKPPAARASVGGSRILVGALCLCLFASIPHRPSAFNDNINNDNSIHSDTRSSYYYSPFPAIQQAAAVLSPSSSSSTAATISALYSSMKRDLSFKPQAQAGSFSHFASASVASSGGQQLDHQQQQQAKSASSKRSINSASAAKVSSVCQVKDGESVAIVEIEESRGSDMSQSTNPFELPISGSTGEIELKIESETHKFFRLEDKRLKLILPLDRDAQFKENTTQILHQPISSIYLQISCLDKRNIDAEAPSSVSLDAIGKNISSPSATTTTITNKKVIVPVLVKVLDLNDNAPKFTQQTYTAQVDELTPVGTILPLDQIHAFDLDSANNGLVEYALVSPPSTKLAQTVSPQSPQNEEIADSNGYSHRPLQNSQRVVAFSGAPLPTTTTTTLRLVERTPETRQESESSLSIKSSDTSVTSSAAPENQQNVDSSSINNSQSSVATTTSTLASELAGQPSSGATQSAGRDVAASPHSPGGATINLNSEPIMNGPMEETDEEESDDALLASLNSTDFSGGESDSAAPGFRTTSDHWEVMGSSMMMFEPTKAVTSSSPRKKRDSGESPYTSSSLSSSSSSQQEQQHFRQTTMMTTTMSSDSHQQQRHLTSSASSAATTTTSAGYTSRQPPSSSQSDLNSFGPTTTSSFASTPSPSPSPTPMASSPSLPKDSLWTIVNLANGVDEPLVSSTISPPLSRSGSGYELGASARGVDHQLMPLMEMNYNKQREYAIANNYNKQQEQGKQQQQHQLNKINSVIASSSASSSSPLEPISDEFFSLELAPGSSRPVIRLKKALDYESRRVHVLTIQATDKANNKQDRLFSLAQVIIKVLDGDDQPPAFVLDQSGCATNSLPPQTTSSSFGSSGSGSSITKAPNYGRSLKRKRDIDATSATPIVDTMTTTTTSSGAGSSVIPPVRQDSFSRREVETTTTKLSTPFSSTTDTPSKKDELVASTTTTTTTTTTQRSPVAVSSSSTNMRANLPKGFKVSDENFEFGDMSSSLEDLPFSDYSGPPTLNGNNNDINPTFSSSNYGSISGASTNQSSAEDNSGELDVEDRLLKLLQDPAAAPSGDAGGRVRRFTTTVAPSRLQHQQQLTRVQQPAFADYSCLQNAVNSQSSSFTSVDGQQITTPEYYSTVMSGESDYVLKIAPQAIRARDRDELNAPIKYTFVNGTPANYSLYFHINPLDASVKQIAPVESKYDYISKFVIWVQAQEQTVKKLSSLAKFTIDVIPSDKNPPMLMPNSYRGVVEENSPIGTLVSVVSLSSANMPTTDLSMPNINQTARQHLRISVIDGDSYSLKDDMNRRLIGPQSATTTTTVAIQTHSRPIVKNQASSQQSSFYYEFETTSDAFKVNKDGFVYVNKWPLDRDLATEANGPSHIFQVTARQLGLASSSARSISSPITINVTLIDLNDNAPVIANSSLLPIQLIASDGSNSDEANGDRETNRAARLIANIRAIDKDSAENSRMWFSIYHVSNNGRDRFRINEESGELEAVGRFVAGEQFSLTLQVQDELQRVNQGILEVFVVPGPNRGGPQFVFQDLASTPNEATLEGSGLTTLRSSGSSSGYPSSSNIKQARQHLQTHRNPGTGYSVEVNEGISPHSAVLQLQAKDPENDPITFSIIDGNVNNDFYINSKSGTIYVGNKLDREEVSAYTLMVQARDSGGLSSNRPVYIQITDNNDENPIFNQSHYLFSCFENQPPGLVLGRVLATDADFSENGRITYQLESATPDGASTNARGRNNNSSLFSIDARSGEIRVLEPLDYEQVQSHTLIVKASDAGENPRSTTVGVIVRVIDVQDESPYFTRNYIELRVNENLPPNYRLTQVQARDLDSVSEITYVLKSGDSSLFQVDPTTGVISTSSNGERVLDYEESRSHTLLVGTLESSQELERLDLAQLANSLLPTNNDEQHHAITERSPVCRIDIQLMDLNDNAPQFKPAQSLPVRVQDSAQLGTLVTRLLAEDADATEANNQLRFELITRESLTSSSLVDPAHSTSSVAEQEFTRNDKCANWFLVDTTSGAVVVKGDLRSDRSLSECHLVVRVRDSGSQPSSLSSLTHLTVFIDHIVELSPASLIGFADTSFTVELEENPPSGKLVKVLPTINKLKNFLHNEMLAAQLSCEIIAGNELGKFSIKENEARDCELRVRDHQQIDYELKQRFTLTVRLNTQASAGLSMSMGGSGAASSGVKTITQVNVQVVDKNDNRPMFVQQPPARYSQLTQGKFLATIAADAPIESQVIQMRATDADSPHSNGLISYEIVNNNELEQRFKIDPLDGVVRISRPVEDIASSRLPLQMKVVARDNPDQTGDSLESSAEVLVNLIDDRHRIALVLKDTTTNRALDSKEEILSAIQERTGLISGLERAESLKIYRNGSMEPDVSGTDFWFYLIEPGSLRIVQSEDQRLKSLLEAKQNSLLDVIEQTLGFTKARLRLPYSQTHATLLNGQFSRSGHHLSGSFSSVFRSMSSSSLGSLLIYSALFIALVGTVVIIYQCGSWSSYSRATKEKFFLQQQQQLQQNQPNSYGYVNFPGGYQTKSSQRSLIGSGNQLDALVAQAGLKSPMSTLHQQQQQQQQHTNTFNSQSLMPQLINASRAGATLDSIYQQLDLHQQHQYSNTNTIQPQNGTSTAAALVNKEYETQMLKMSVIFDDSHSLVDEHNANLNTINQNQLLT